MDLKRDEIKYVRDLSKSAYKKEANCFICGTEDELQFHHFYSMTLLWNAWKRKHGIVITTVEEIEIHRETFRKEHKIEIYEETVTLCKHHHMGQLHKVYGKVPALVTAKKQKRWCEIQRDKHIGEENGRN